jgi:hypothetical protein
MRTILVLLAAAGLSIASGTDRYSITLLQPAVVAGVELEPGRYALALTDQQMELRRGDVRVSARVQVETADETFRDTTIRLEQEKQSGKYRISQIRLGGTTRRLVLAAQ